MRKIVILIILLIIALVLIGYFTFAEKPESEGPGKSDASDTGFRGPTGRPYVNGPTAPPPGSNY